MAESSPLSSSIVNHNNSDTDPNLSRKKRRKISNINPAGNSNESDTTRWRTETEQQIYSSKLVHALTHLRRPESPAAASRSVRDAADRVLANSAKGKTRWSRAILTSRLSLQLAHVNRKHKKAKAKSGSLSKKKPAVQRKSKLPPVQKKVKALSRLIPGCRKISLPSLLEETTDYIAALEMQVKALAFLTGMLNGGVSGAGGNEQSNSLA